jgi:hypothetical protein
MRHANFVSVALLILAMSRCALALDAPAPETQPSDLNAQVAALVKKLGAKRSDESIAAEIRLCMLRPEAFPAIEKAAEDASIPAAARERLHGIVERERPLHAARLRRQKVRDEEIEWNVKTAVAAYIGAGKHDPKWNDLACEGIRLAATRLDADSSNPYPPEAAPPQAARVPLEKAVAAGCDDPLVLYMLAGVLADTSSADPAQLLTLRRKAADEMLLRNYPAYRKEWAVLRCYIIEFRLANADANARGLDHFDNAVGAHLSQLSQAMISLWPRICKDGAPPECLYEVANFILDLNKHNAEGLDEIYERLEPPLQKVLGSGSLFLAFKATFNVEFAWQARGGGWAAHVTAEGAKLMAERLNIAEEAAQKAFDLDPNDPHAPTEMLTVELGQGKGRAVMEKWFDRAMAADPVGTAVLVTCSSSGAPVTKEATGAAGCLLSWTTLTS